MNKNISISESLSFGWNTFKSNWKFWLIVFFLASMGGLGSSTSSSLSRDLRSDQNGSNFISYNTEMAGKVLGIDSFRDSSVPITNLQKSNLNPNLGLFLVPVICIGIAVAIFSALVSTTVRMGYINLVLDAARGKQVYYRTLLNQVSLKKAYRFLAVAFTLGLLVILGLIFLIIPGIYFALKYAFATTVLVDEDLGIKDSFKRSAEITKGIRMKLLGLVLILAIISLIVSIPTFGLGLIVMAVVSSLSVAYLYVNKVSEKTEPAS